MLRGLCSNWKQPVFFDFDQPITADLLNKILMSIEEAGIEVWAITCDGGSSNQALFNSLGVNKEKTSFLNPFDPTRNVYAFQDPPHLIKLVRNHVLDEGIYVDGSSTLIGKEDFRVYFVML